MPDLRSISSSALTPLLEGGAKSAHEHGQGAELGPPYSKGVLIPAHRISTLLGSDVTAGGANSAHGYGPGTELAPPPPDYKGVLNQRMDMVEALN
ncbi:hypothetical protein J6590_049486 [Homalodisca vitripennis]|nr:hypothetical protein J6590_049486 [Homalodisca vitripennis]